jgi:hypothetical protein
LKATKPRIVGLGAALLSGLIALQAGAAPSKPVIVVFPIEDASGSLKPTALRQLTDYFGVKIAEAGRYVVVPRREIERLLQDKKGDSYQHCKDESCQIEIGRELAAQKVLYAQIFQVAGSCAVTTTVYDLKLAAAEAAVSEKGGCSDADLVAALERIAGRLGAPGQERPGASAPREAEHAAAPLAATTASREKFTLRVEAAPADALVMLDGHNLGKGSVTVDLEPTTAHELRVEREGYQTQIEKVEIQRDETRRVELAVTAESRAARREWFGAVLAPGATLTGSYGGSVWLQALDLRLLGVSWTLIEGAFGLFSIQESFFGTSYPVDRKIGLMFYGGTRPGYRVELGSAAIDLGLGVGFYSLSRGDDALIAVALSPVARLVMTQDSGFTYGIGMRAVVPFKNCSLAGSQNVNDFARCAGSKPVLLQLELPIGASW